MKNMDYEKKYNDALNWMRELYPGLHGETKEDAEHYFPELKESEDERIRKTIVTLIKDLQHYSTNYAGVDPTEMLAWLEKQSKEDEHKEPTEDWREKRKKECPFRKADGCERYANVISECTGACSWVVDYPKLKEIQDKKKQKQQMPDSTQLIAEWEKEKAVLEQKDFRGDAERMAYNAFLDGFIKGLGYEGTK